MAQPPEGEVARGIDAPGRARARSIARSFSSAPPSLELEAARSRLEAGFFGTEAGLRALAQRLASSDQLEL